MNERVRRNLELGRRLWKTASDGDPSAILEIFSPDVCWRTYGTGPNAGEYRGIDQVLAYLAKTGQRADDLRSELLDVLASERGAVLLHRSEFASGSKTLVNTYFLWLRIEDGVVEEVASVPWDQAMADAFWKPH